MNHEEYLEEVAFLKKCNMEYHSANFGESEISDYEYDKRRRYIQDYETMKGISEEESFSSIIGHIPTGSGDKHKHTRPRKSLENALNKKEAEEWIRKWGDIFGADAQVIAENKFDGIATVLRYVDGKLVIALTRGDGEVGEDITRHVLQYVQNTIDILGDVEIEGESVVTISAFNRSKYRGEGQYANTRAMVSGLLHKVETTHLHRNILFIPYGIHTDGSENLKQSQRLQLLRELGFISETALLCSIHDVSKTFDIMKESQKTQDVECDGVVFKINDIEKQQFLGETSHSPRWAFAYKNPPVMGICKILGVDFQVGRSGDLSPVARITPTMLQGVVVSSAFVHNEKRMKDRGGIQIGSTYEIYRSGDVIPHLGECVERNYNAEDIQFPKTCPCCSSAVVKSGEAYRCTNTENCEGVVAAKIVFATSRDVLDIDGIGEVMVRELVSKQLVKDVSDIYSLTVAQFEAIGYSSLIASKIINNINASKKKSKYRFLMALCIPGVGKVTARSIATPTMALNDLLGWTDSKEIVAKKIDGVGSVTAKAIASFFSNEANVKNTTALFGFSDSNEAVVREEHGTRILSGIAGNQFVFTGTFAASRIDMEEFVLRNGGNISNNVTHNTTYLVKGDKPGAKVRIALARGVKIINEEQFNALVNTNAV